MRPSATDGIDIHWPNGNKGCWDFNHSQKESVQVNVPHQITSIQRQCIKDEGNCKPVNKTKYICRQESTGYKANKKINCEIFLHLEDMTQSKWKGQYHRLSFRNRTFIKTFKALPECLLGIIITKSTAPRKHWTVLFSSKINQYSNRERLMINTFCIIISHYY